MNPDNYSSYSKSKQDANQRYDKSKRKRPDSTPQNATQQQPDAMRLQQQNTKQPNPKKPRVVPSSHTAKIIPGYNSVSSSYYPIQPDTMKNQPDTMKNQQDTMQLQDGFTNLSLHPSRTPRNSIVGQNVNNPNMTDLNSRVKQALQKMNSSP